MYFSIKALRVASYREILVAVWKVDSKFVFPHTNLVCSRKTFLYAISFHYVTTYVTVYSQLLLARLILDPLEKYRKVWYLGRSKSNPRRKCRSASPASTFLEMLDRLSNNWSAVRCQRQRWLTWFVLTILFLAKEGESDFASDCIRGKSKSDGARQGARICSRTSIP